ncbi:U-box domain-containing protein 5-like [Corylus avellana]|uniref:U-box domain-containing protein 5-like n=1 Tax=Corylus avellana TaxID=13451 RepID=UPI00286C30C1|nr:U-box domain-containing protein 5-like [Corylus avellana]
MESDAAELFEKLPDPSSFKVHFLICTRVLKLVNRISRIFPAIAAACPQCLSGIQELSLLNHAIKQTQQHLQKYSESSKIYLAVTGDAVVSQCQRLKNLLEQCLGQIQTMVQRELATEISHIMDYHGRATFSVDSSEEEAGKAVQRLLQQANSTSDSIENSQVRSLQLAASTLHITSPKAILIERQTINKQLDKVGDSDPRETEILRRLLCLLNKYGNLILQEQLSNDCVQNEGSFTFENGRNNSAYSQSVDVESHTGCGHHEAQVEDILRRAVLHEEQLSNDCVQNEGAFAFENGRNDYAYSQSVDVESRTEEQLSNDCVQNKGEFAFENGRNNSAYSQSVDVESRIGCGHHEAQVDDIPRRAILPEEQLSNDCVQNEGEFAFENGRNNSAHSQSVDVESHTGCGHHEAQVDDILTRAIVPKEQLSNDCVQNVGEFAFEKGRNNSAYSQSVDVESHTRCGHNQAQVDGILKRAILPKEQLNHYCVQDAVAFAFEKLPDPSSFKVHSLVCTELLKIWCMRNGVTISEPTIVVRHFRETSSSSIDSLFSSIDSLFSSENGRCLSNMSLESLDSTYTWDSSNTGIADGLNLIPMQTKHEHKYQSYGNIHEEDLKFLSKLAELQWESQCEVVENVKKHLDYSEEAYQFTSYENFGEPLVRFLEDARDLHDVKAQKAGSQLLLAFVTKNRSGISYFREETFSLLATVINSEITKEALEILEVLSGHPYCRAKIEASGALMSIPKMLDSNNRDFQELAIKILCNLSSNSDICSHIVSLECIPKLVPLLADSTLAGNCAFVLKNLCNVEEARVSVAETNGCISSVAGLLSASSHEDQENAVAVLLSLCSQRVQYCQLVMDEGVIPALVYISINGNDKGRVSALELLRCLRDVECDNDRECPGPYIDASRDSTDPSKERKSTKASAFRGVMSAFTKKKK